MSMVATDIKDLFKISIKPRHDTYTDQYNRIFMVKILLACTIVMGLCWYNDKFNCMVPETTASYEKFEDFVGTTCWIQGMYVYKELRNHTDDVAYYGIPKDADYDGMINDRIPCRVKDKFHKVLHQNCVPMTKTYFIQYQYMPFFIATLALLYFIPYMIHKTINHDLINLREQIKKDEPDIPDIVKHYFKERKNKNAKPYMLTIKQIMNILVKLTYILVNLVAFFGTDSLLNGEFYSYGRKWVSWSKLNNTLTYDYMGARDFPKPGNEMLPPFGFCELYSSAKDIKTSFADKHKVICEISQHILYQYVFILLWFCMIIGIVVSIIGLILLIVNYLIGIVGICKLGRGNQTSQRIFERLTYREIEYLEFMRKKNIPVYGEVLDKLREKFLDDSPPESVGSSYDHPPKSDFPMYPMKGKSPHGPYAL